MKEFFASSVSDQRGGRMAWGGGGVRNFGYIGAIITEGSLGDFIFLVIFRFVLDL